ncbi:MAG: CDGSH iron-sulfur domain-containing protein [Gemmatimonadaceae bacterium]
MTVTITVRPNGPLHVDLRQGDVTITDQAGTPVAMPQGRTTIALCRCGGSANKPFCDGTHSRIEWKEY